MSCDVHILGPADLGILDRVAPGVFDDPVHPEGARIFLEDARHRLAVAIDAGVVVGMVTSVHYEHPDKPRPECWINEVGVAPSHQGRGIARALMARTLDAAREAGCTEAWVLTDRDNAPAMRLYAGAGGVEAERDQVMFSFPLR